MPKTLNAACLRFCHETPKHIKLSDATLQVESKIRCEILNVHHEMTHTDGSKQRKKPDLKGRKL